MDHPKLKMGPDGSLLLNFGEYGEEVEVAAISGDGRRVLTVREVGVARGRQVNLEGWATKNKEKKLAARAAKKDEQK